MKKQIRAIYTRIKGVETKKIIVNAWPTVRASVIITVCTLLFVHGCVSYLSNPVFSTPARVECR